MHALQDVDKLQVCLAKPCGRHGASHTCLDAFRANPVAVRNWRVLWRSMSPASRRKALLQAYAASLAAYEQAGSIGKWTMNHKILGINVCNTVFHMITGIGGSSLQKARVAAQEHKQSSLSLSELPTFLQISANSKPRLYIDCRLWLEEYAETHGDWDPVDGNCALPAGRKLFYFLVYEHQRKTQKMESASLDTFCCAWRCECPWLRIARTLCSYTACGICSFLRDNIDRTPRDAPEPMAAYKTRLAKHYEFQST